MFCSRCGTETQNNAKFCPSCGLDLSATTPLAAVKGAHESGERLEIDVVREALKDEYQVIEELGRGGMAIVYHGRDLQLERDVAIKVLPFSLSFDKEFVERFQREARTAARLEHPHIIPIYRVGKAGRVIYFVMKFLRGKSLADVIEDGGPVPIDDIRRLLMETAGALGYAHKHGIVHRDIKPDNILFDDTGRSMVTDFGIAKAATGTRLTGTGMAIGTPHYMSPEQARAQPLDGRSDIYSLGVVAFQCLTGKVPFDGEDAFSIGYKHIMEEVPEPDLKDVEQSELFSAVRKMMAKKPEHRYQTAEELIRVIEEQMPGTSAFRSVSSRATTPLPRQSIAAAEPRLSSPTTPTTPMPTAGAKGVAAAPAKRKKRSPALLAASLVVLLLGGGGGGYYWYTNIRLPSQQGRPGTTPPGGPLGGAPAAVGAVPAAADSLAGDSGLAVLDSAAADSAGAAPDTAAGGAPVAAVPETGLLIIEVTQRGARFRVDAGEFQPSNRFEVSPGTHKVEVQASGFLTASEPVSVAKGDTVTLPVTLKPRGPTLAELCANAPNESKLDLTRCYDQAPGTADVTTVDLPANFAGEPQPMILWVLVSADGRALRAVPGQSQQPDPDFAALAVEKATTLKYTPAKKGGRAVQAWAQIAFYPVRQ